MIDFKKSKNTVSVYKYWFLKQNQYKDLKHYIEFCKENYSISTLRVILSSIKYFSTDDFIKTLKMPANKNNFKEIIVSEYEYKKIMNDLIFEDSFVSNRNKQIIKVLWYTGVRIGELQKMKWKDIKNDQIEVVGKGDRKRYIPFKKNLFDEISRNGDFVFTSKNGEKLSYSSLYKIFVNVNTILNRNDISPHTFRHSFATRLILKGLPMPFISKCLGHSSLDVTMRYLHFTNKDYIEELKLKDWS